MKTRIIEASNRVNWGKFLLARLTDELKHHSAYEGAPIFDVRHWPPDLLWVFDLETQEGAAFDLAQPLVPQLERHQIWVCILYEPFLVWLQAQKTTDLDALPATADLAHVPAGLVGYRRTGPEDFHARVTLPADVGAQLRMLCPTLRLAPGGSHG